MKVKLDKTWEFHNLVRTPKGFRSRRAWSVADVTLFGRAVAGFSIESPTTSEVFHYIFEQSPTTLFVTLTVYTETLLALYSLPLGVMQSLPVITYALVNNQVMISSPSFSSTLYGQVGGGVITAVATVSQDPTITTLEVPVGHICSFADRVAVASGSVVSVNDARTDVDPRTFTSLGLLAVPGSILDMFQAVDGQLYLFTTDGVFTVPADALSVGQGIAGFISKIPGIFTRLPRNACATPSGVVILQQSSILVINGGSQREIPIGVHDGRRKNSKVVEIEDLRAIGQVFPTQTGCIIAFGGDRDFFVDVDLSADHVSYSYNFNDPLTVVGVLRSRDGEPILVVQNSSASKLYYEAITGGDVDGQAIGDNVTAFAIKAMDLEGVDEPRIRRLTLVSDSIGKSVLTSVSGTQDTDTVPSLSTDAIVGTATWSSSVPFNGRTTRSTRLSVNVKTTEPVIEVGFYGSGRRVGDTIDVELGGIMRNKRDKQS